MRGGGVEGLRGGGAALHTSLPFHFVVHIFFPLIHMRLLFRFRFFLCFCFFLCQERQTLLTALSRLPFICHYKPVSA